MKKRKSSRIFVYILLLLIVIAAAAIIFSPYGRHDGFDYKLMKHTVDINAPANTVYNYLGNSANAKDWSVFVDHITTLNADSVPDGAIGSRRRCFVNADETGTRWDETIVENIPGVKRQITIYDMVDFPMTAENLATEQLYEPLDSNRTRLTFTVFYRNAEPSLWETFKTHLASYKIISVFKGNMDNIKRIVESQQ